MFIKLRKKMYCWLRQAYDEEENIMPDREKGRGRSIGPTIGPAKVSRKSNESLDSKGIYLKIIPASGGVAIETTYYDDRSGDQMCALYIIPEDKELSDELAKIITLQSMR